MRRQTLLLLSLLILPLLGLAQKPSLLPMPQKVEWGREQLTLQGAVGISLAHDSLIPIANHLIENLSKYQLASEIQPEGMIELQIVPESKLLPHKEAYRLEVGDSKVSLQASTLHGLFNAVQTFDQLIGDNATLQHCVIEDAPAFSWRGYMVDVGRNYQSMEMLKEQIETMASLKLNLFHFHLTENVAWRLEVQRHPELTAPETMTRDHGLFYSIEEIKELQKFCEDRFITFLMEIDMPGHSAAFTRATGYDMQSEEGLEIVLDILDEVTTTYDFKYFHIGADEVKITNEDFVPTVTKFLEDRGITVIGWQPGGNYPLSVWRQLWSNEKIEESEALGAIQIDSRNLYVNHMDALETVPLIFNHQVCDVDRETPTKRGATLCLWNDRRLRCGEDNLTHNALYPAMFAFSEKVWCGGGKKGSYVGIDSRPEWLEAFRDLEQRITTLQKESFRYLDFPYVAQGDIEWNLYGPYDNAGKLESQFLPEFTSDLSTLEVDTTLVGGTIIIRHFWSPTIKGHYLNLPENSTFYAHRKVWSDEAREANMWIGFYDFSRSNATSTPEYGTWNNLESKIWLNGQEIAPPRWLRAGQKGNDEYPYEDENYIMRPPHRVQLKAGWNDILVKCPIGKFASGVWYAPHKWMFTAVILD